MMIAVFADDEQWEELIKSGILSGCKRVSILDSAVENADAFLVLDEPTGFTNLPNDRPVLINSVTNTLSKMELPGNFVRMNGWRTFIGRDKWEIAGGITSPLKQVMAALGKKIISVRDTEGLVAARIVSMIINEAYFAMGENISTREEIDLAMKLGTNYPYGPFEWASKIGIRKIFTLLEKLGATDKRYLPAPLLKQEAGI